MAEKGVEEQVLAMERLRSNNYCYATIHAKYKMGLPLMATP